MIRVLHFGSYWQKENDIIFAMVKDLENMSDAFVVDTHLYDQDKYKYVIDDCSLSSLYPVRVIKNNVIQDAVEKLQPDAVIVNAGGMSLSDEMFLSLRAKKIKTIGISLSDPDVFPYNGKIYAKKFDFFYTNSKYSFLSQYKDANIDHLPFAASRCIHRPIKNEEKHDVIIVGSYRQDRMNVVKALSIKFDVGIYGEGWTEMGVRNHGQVNGIEHLRALNSGRIYISFSKTVAGYNNVKVGLFEAAACKICLVTEGFPEVYDYFEKDKEIITYSDINDLSKKITYLLGNEKVLENVTNKSYKRFLKDHTWEKRWTKVLSKIE